MTSIDFFYRKKKISIIGYSDQDHITSLIKKHSIFYEIDLLEYVSFVLKDKSGLILDIGANIGNHSVYFGMFTDCAVASFEPNPKVSTILEKNLNRNKVGGKVFKFALGSEEGKYTIEIPEDMSSNIGAARLKASVEGSINVRRLDDALSEVIADFNNLPIIAIKADIEGMEADMIKGAILTLKHYKPDLFLEISSSQSMVEIEALLSPLGYRKIYSFAATPVWHFVNKENIRINQIIKIIFYIFTEKKLKPLLKKIAYRFKHAFGNG